MSSASSEPPYPHPPGRPVPPALPGRRPRALPAAPPPAGAGGDDEGLGDYQGSDDYPGRADYPNRATGGYTGPANGSGGPQDAADWFAGTKGPQARDQGQGRSRQDFTGQSGYRQDGYGPGGFGGNAAGPGAGMPGGYSGSGPGYPGEQPGYQAQRPGNPREASDYDPAGSTVAFPQRQQDGYSGQRPVGK